MTPFTCSFCQAPLSRTFVDLGMAPLVSAYLEREQLHEPERFYPVHAYVCERCFLVQLPQSAAPSTLFSEYPYFSSVSVSWLEHARAYVDMMTRRFRLGPSSQVVEVASNDGYLLQYFKEREIPIQGVEPARNVARVARRKGIPTRVAFFGARTAGEMVAAGQRADLIVGNNVLAHVPDINDFVAGLRILLKPEGMITLEFPHLLRTLLGNQFDQVFHEHFSYLSLLAVEAILAAHDLTVFDVQELPTHGGSLRVFARHAAAPGPGASPSVQAMRRRERADGLDRGETYDRFSARARAVKYRLLYMLVRAKRAGRSIVGYGAAGKGCIMLNYCGIRSEFLDFLADASPAKHGKYMPGVHLPIHPPERLADARPDYVLILPWNLREEITEQLAYIRSWGGKFILPIPEPTVVA